MPGTVVSFVVTRVSASLKTNGDDKASWELQTLSQRFGEGGAE